MPVFETTPQGRGQKRTLASRGLRNSPRVRDPFRDGQFAGRIERGCFHRGKVDHSDHRRNRTSRQHYGLPPRTATRKGHCSWRPHASAYIRGARTAARRRAAGRFLAWPRTGGVVIRLAGRPSAWPDSFVGPLQLNGGTHGAPPGCCAGFPKACIGPVEANARHKSALWQRELSKEFNGNFWRLRGTTCGVQSC